MIVGFIYHPSGVGKDGIGRFVEGHFPCNKAVHEYLCLVGGKLSFGSHRAEDRRDNGLPVCQFGCVISDYVKNTKRLNGGHGVLLTSILQGLGQAKVIFSAM
jgi:hypothetical protein